MRILTIDDDKDTRALIRFALELSGIEVDEAASASDGVSAAAHTPFDAVLLDILMPGLSGMTAFSMLRSHPRSKKMPVIILSAKPESVRKEDFERYGAVAVLRKPFDPETLGPEIRAILAKAESGGRNTQDNHVA